MSTLGTCWSYVTIKALKIICSIKIEIQGVENLPQKYACIIACKHQSAIETILFHQYLKSPVYVVKKELKKIPFYGWFLEHMGMISIDRKGGVTALKRLITGCERNLNENRSVIIFPEGTRVKPFVSANYHSGIIALHKKFPDTKIIPVALNSGLFWPKDSLIKYPGTVIVRILPAIDKTLDQKEFIHNLKTMIDHHSDDLCKNNR